MSTKVVQEDKREHRLDLLSSEGETASKTVRGGQTLRNGDIKRDYPESETHVYWRLRI